ncbi:MAG: DUF6600 domain-containing protein [Bacteroidota bacterium]
MKRFLQITGTALLIMLFAGFRNTASAQPGGEVSYQNFYDELSPYGRWIDYPEYGYVWCPDEGADFRPYSTNGHWVWSDDYEWMWVSDYSWGWAPFHYGRWFYDDMYGWMWVPGYDWSPAWVAWRGGGDYYGWAPLRPGINISIGFSIGSYAPPVNYWCFAPSRYITSPRIYDYCVSSRQNVTIINNTTIINNYNYNRNVFVTGPRRNEVERFTNQRINSVRVRDAYSPGRSGYRNNEVSVYRPGIQRENNRGFAPRQFDNYRGRNDNNIALRNDRVANRNGFNDRVERNNNPRFENRNIERPNDNANRNDRFNNSRIEQNNNNRFGDRRSNEIQQQQNPRQFEQRGGNNSPDIRNQRNNEEVRRPDNNVRERSVRDVFGRDNRPGFDRPAPNNNFERRNDNGFNGRRMENNNRVQENSPVRQERREVFQPQQQQRQSFPQMNQRQQEQPRRFEPQTPNRGNGGDNGRGGFNRGRRG